jgi:hypothetical protein
MESSRETSATKTGRPEHSTGSNPRKTLPSHIKPGIRTKVRIDPSASVTPPAGATSASGIAVAQ